LTSEQRQAAPVDEVRDGLDHAELDVVVDATHETEVQDGQPAVRRADQVARVRVGLQVRHTRTILQNRLAGGIRLPGWGTVA